MFDYLIVGRGICGSVWPRRLRRSCRPSALLIDKRPHIGGNAYRPPVTTRASWSTNTARISSTPIRTRMLNICRGLPNGGLTSIACSRSIEACLLPIPINRTTVSRFSDWSFHRSRKSSCLPRVEGRAAWPGNPQLGGRGSSAELAASFTKPSSRAIRASSGASIRANSTSR